MIVRRFEAATGNQAVLVETGETFEALATPGWNRRCAKAGSSCRRAAEERETATGQARACPHCGGQRFESLRKGRLNDSSVLSAFFCNSIRLHPSRPLRVRARREDLARDDLGLADRQTGAEFKFCLINNNS